MRPNPPPDLSRLPNSISELGAKLGNIKDSLTDEELDAVSSFRRIANYMAAAMIYLRQNTLLETPLKKEDIKPRLLGHWGTCPGLSLIYAHLNLLIKKNDLNMFYVVGPGHGAPAILSCLWLEDSFAPFYKDLTRTKSGFEALISGFSTPKGFPSHVSADVPGSIHEGGELGYALSVAYGAVLDNPDLIVACIVGDGEAETGPTATAWHAHKFIDPVESGAVIPILHVNGFKISEKTLFGTMDDKEIISLFTGYGYQVCIVEDLENLDYQTAAAMQWALAEIRSIQGAARAGTPMVKPRWPMIVLRTPKGLSGPKFLKGEPIEGSWRSHQVPLASPTTDQEQFEMLQSWLESYKPSEIFGGDVNLLAKFDQFIIPTDPAKRMGQRRETYCGHHPLDVPAWEPYGPKKGSDASATRETGKYLAEVFRKNPKIFRLWSPDELTSNKLDGVFAVTDREFEWDPDTRDDHGRVIEILSEHTCQGMMQGYTLTGRTGIFPSYESFLGIVNTMMVQYGKFCKTAQNIPWRGDIGTFNYIETSTWTRQEHNGFSHQNPAFIGSVLNLKAKIARIYLPPDANCMLSTMAHCLNAKNYINLIVASKHDTPVWLSPEEAAEHCKRGASVWKFASTDGGKDPDVVIAGIGVEVTFEVIAAAALLRRIAPELRVRVVNVTDLMVLGPYGTHPHALSDEAFNELFTPDKRIHFNFHGYPTELKGLLFGRRNIERVTMEGYQEEGTTTTPLAMMVLNKVSRYDVAKNALQASREANPKVDAVADKLIEELDKQIDDFWVYIKANGKDPEGMFDRPEL